MVSPTPQSKCSTCRRFIPAWDLHLKCVLHWDRDCTRMAPCDVCVVWTEGQWRAVHATVAKIEAKALLRAAAQTTKTKGKVPPMDVSAVRPPKAKKLKLPIHNANYVDNVQDDLFYVPTAQVGNVSLLSTSRSPETRRRAEALAYARDTDQGFSTEAMETTLPD